MTITLNENGYEAKATLSSFTATVNEERFLVVSTERDLRKDHFTNDITTDV